MMNIFEFMKTIRIENTDVQVVILNNNSDNLCVNWLFECPEHPTCTHGRVSRIVGEKGIEQIRLMVDDVKHIIEEYRNAKHNQ